MEVARLRASAYFEESTNRFRQSLEKKYAQREEEALASHVRREAKAAATGAAPDVLPDGSTRKVCLCSVGGDGRVVGALDVSLREGGEWAYVDNACVSSAHRRQGIASALVAAAADVASDWGARDLFAHVVRGNTPAELCYAKSGFSDASANVGVHMLVLRGNPALPPGARLIGRPLP